MKKPTTANKNHINVKIPFWMNICKKPATAKTEATVIALSKFINHAKKVIKRVRKPQAEPILARITVA